MIRLLRVLLLLLIGSACVGAWPHRLPADDGQPPPLDPAAKKAVGRFLENLLGEITEKARQQENTDQSRAPDPVDERALVNREQRTQLQRARRMLEEGRREAGIRLLQYLLNVEEDSVLLTREGAWRSLHAIAEEAILHADAQTRGRYRQRYARIAEEQLIEARRAGSVRALARLTRRYFATPAGFAAADEIASLMIDAGEPAEAAYWYQRLIAADAPLTRYPLWRRKAAQVLDRAGVPVDASSRPTEARDNQTEVQGQRTSLSVRANSHRDAWTQPFGGPTHTGHAAASDPVLIERWSQPVTDRPQNIEQITQLVEDLQEGGTACIPAAAALAVDGKIVFRTLRGLSVVDASSGRRLWESPEGVSVERLLAGEAASRPGAETDASRLRPMSSYQGNGADQHTLANLLFRDGVYGLISSDGERVFVLEDHATLSYRPPGYYRGQSQNDDPHGRDWETNRLAAYDLDSGTRLWSIGGPEDEEPFTPELAGTLFQGPPVIEGDELFVIGEQHGAEILFVLDRRSGSVLWSQTLCGVSAEIEYDLVRRWWPALPAVGKGVVVCPTTVGWVVAVDRHERRIRWAQRLINRHAQQRHARQSAVAMTSPLNSRWCRSAPRLVGDRIILTPAELPDAEYHSTPRLICLNTLTGKTSWDREKESLLYVGGVLGETLLLVGSDRVEARSLADGERLWKTPLPEHSGRPSGRGVITGTDYLLPLQSGALWRIDLSDGSVIARSMLPAPHDAGPSLGNLLVAGKRLVSLSPFGVTCFEDRVSVEKLPAQAATGRLNDRDRLRAAELQLIDGNDRSAVGLLREIDPSALDPAAAAKARELHWRSLAAVIESDPAMASSELEELQGLADSERGRLSLRRLQAEHHAARGDLATGFDIYWNLARESRSAVKVAQTPASQFDSGTTSDGDPIHDRRRPPFGASSHTPLVEDGETSVRLDCWLAARLREAWTAMSPSAQQAVDQRIESTVDSLLQQPPDDWAWWARVLRFHPQGRRLDERLAVRAIENDRLTEAEIRLLRLLDSRAPASARSEALRQLITLLDRQGRTDDSAAIGGQSVRGQSGGDSETPTADPPRLRRADPRQDWSSEVFALTRNSLLFNRQSPEVSLSITDGLPSLGRFEFEVQPGLGRLNVDAHDGQRLWETPLRSQVPSRSYQSSTAVSVGQLLFVVHQGVLHALSLPDRELLWQRPFNVRASGSASLLRSMPSPPDELAAAAGFRMNNGLSRRRSEAGLLAVARPGYVCYFDRNSITAADPLTGLALWTRRGIRPQSTVAGNDRHLFVIPPGQEDAFALRADDGTQVDLPHLESALASAVGLFDGGLVTLDVDRSEASDTGHQAVRLELIDPLTGEPAWESSFAEQTQFALPEADTLLAIEPDGTVRLLNWAERTDRVLCVLDQHLVENARSIYAIADREQVYLSLNARPDRSSRSDLFLSMPVNGPLLAIDRSGGIVWQASAENQHLLMEHLSQLPVLVLLSRRAAVARTEINAQQVHLQLLDKWTGRRLLDKSRYVSPGSFRSFDVDLVARIIDFQGSRERLRIQPTDVEPIPE